MLTVKTRQKYLKELGFYKGKVDGKNGIYGTNAAGLCEVNWLAVGSASLVAGIVCVLMAISQIETDEERGDE